MEGVTVEPRGRAEAAARFEALAQRVGDPLRRYLARRCDPSTAEDVLADTLLVLWRRLDEVPGDAELPWCYAVARNCLANAERAARRRHGLLERIVRLQPPGEVAGQDLPDPAVHRALARLPATDREVLRLSAWEDLEPREIAEVLGITSNAASIRLHRARRRLADLLEVDRQEAGRQDGQAPGHRQVEGLDRDGSAP